MAERENGRTLNGIEGTSFILGVEIFQLLSHDQCKLNLIAELNTSRPDDGTFSGQEDRRRGLQKEERLLRPRAVELGDMVTGG